MANGTDEHSLLDGLDELRGNITKLMDLKDYPSSGKFRIENPEALKLKNIIKDYLESEEMFYASHSQFATYIEPRYLEIFKTEIVAFCSDYIREQKDKNMGPEGKPGPESHANTRGLHVQDVATHAKDVASVNLLNVLLAELGGLIHDLGHTAFAHVLESVLSNYLREKGIVAQYPHALISGIVIAMEQIHEKTIERLEKEKGRSFTKEEIAKYDEYKAILLDIAFAHNGEGLDREVIANSDKTVEDIYQEFINGFVYPKADRKIVGKTPEANIVRFLDVISYVMKDYRDARKSKVIDPETQKKYEAIFREMGIDEEIINSDLDKDNKLVRAVTYALRDDLTKNSSGINGARMSEKMAKLMYDLRALNNTASVRKRTRKITGLFPERAPKLVDKFAQYFLMYDDDSKLEEGHVKSFIKTTKRKYSQKGKDICTEIVKKGTEEAIRREVKAILENDTDATKTVRRKRFEQDIKKLKEAYGGETGNLPDAVVEKYISRIQEGMRRTPEQSMKDFKVYIKKTHPELKNDAEVEEFARNNSELRIETLDECLAQFESALYIGRSANTFFLDLLKEEGLLSDEEYASRYELGGVNPSMDETEKEQEEEARRRAQTGEDR